MFITFEGPDGSGKTTQLKLLKEHLENKGQKNLISTKEPGGTSVGIEIRKLLLHSDKDSVSPLTELLLFASDRSQHISEIIAPGISNNKIILCDRYVDSTIAYQVGGRQIDEQLVLNTINCATNGLLPDHTFLFDVETEEGLSRAANEQEHDRLEQEAISFHQRVRAKYIELAKQNPQRFSMINTSQRTIEDIHQEVVIKFSELVK